MGGRLRDTGKYYRVHFLSCDGIIWNHTGAGYRDYSRKGREDEKEVERFSRFCEEFANYEREPGQDMTLLVTADGKAVKKSYYTRIFYDRIVFQTQGSYIPPVFGIRGDYIREYVPGEASSIGEAVVEEALKRGCLVDGHASLLTGRDLQAFRAAGIDSDHTLRTADKLREELALGFNVQIQSGNLSREMAEAMNSAPVQDQICLVTDDVPLPKLMERGHLNRVVAEAVALGLDPVRAVRFATINPARRLRLYDVGAIAPGMIADIQLVRDLREPRPEAVFCAGRPVCRGGRLLEPLPRPDLSAVLRGTVRCAPVAESDLVIPAPAGETALVNVIREDGVSARTTRAQRELPVTADADGHPALDTGGYLKMAVFNRYGKRQHGLALIEGMGPVSGAVALTYGHDAHNLTVFGGNDADMALAANGVIEMQGGICAASGGRLLTQVPLPLAGLLSPERPETLLAQLRAFLSD